jgi:hypothetical protein
MAPANAAAISRGSDFIITHNPYGGGDNVRNDNNVGVGGGRIK